MRRANRPGEVERETLQSQRITFDELSREHVDSLCAKWREVFASRVLERTGKAVYRGFDWHAFSYEFTRAIRGSKAVVAYEEQSVREVFVLPDSSVRRGVGFSCHGPRLPDLRGCDVLVVPPDFTWTTAFTHEDGGIGPFFAMADP